MSEADRQRELNGRLPSLAGCVATLLFLVGCEGPLHHTEPLLSDRQVRDLAEISGIYQIQSEGAASSDRMYLRLWSDDGTGHFIEGYMGDGDGQVATTLMFPAWLRVGQRDNGDWLGEIRHDSSQGAMYLPMPMARDGEHFQVWPLVLMSDYAQQKEKAQGQGFQLGSAGRLQGDDRSRSRFLELVDALVEGQAGLPLVPASFDFAQTVDQYRRSYLQELDGRWYRALEAENSPPDAKMVRGIQYLAERDDPWAHYAVARFYGNGAYVERDIERARQHAERAVQLGEAKGHGILGYLAQHGLGTEADLGKARRHYRLAAKADDPAATRNLAVLLLQEGKESREGIALFQQAVALGDAWAAYELGRRYHRGDGVATSVTRAFALHKQAAEWGHTEASYFVGWALEYGKGVGKDAKAAMPHYQRAAKQKHIDAQIAVGRLHWNGTGVKKSPSSAIGWFRQAAEQGSVPAMSWLGHALSTAPGEGRNDRQAVDWFKRAAEAGDAFSMWRYGVHLAEGRGVDRSMHDALDWLTRAEQAGEGRAREDRERVETLIAQAIDNLNRQQGGQARAGVAAGGGSAGPTEEDLRAIYAAQTGAINEQQADLRRRCENREFQRGGGDPFMAMQCLMIMAGGQMQTGVRGVRLVGCEKARGRPGWYCDWQVALDIDSRGMPGSLNQLMGQWQACTGRLVRVGERWEMVERRC